MVNPLDCLFEVWATEFGRIPVIKLKVLEKVRLVNGSGFGVRSCLRSGSGDYRCASGATSIVIWVAESAVAR